VSTIGEPGKEQTYVVRDAETLFKMMDSSRNISGMKTIEEMQL
jgi:hypothetical protein